MKTPIESKIAINEMEIAEFKKQIAAIKERYEGRPLPKSAQGDIKHIQAHIRDLTRDNIKLKHYDEDKHVKCFD